MTSVANLSFAFYKQDVFVLATTEVALNFFIMILIQNRILINKPDFPENGEKFTHEVKVLDDIVCINSLDKLKQDDNIILGFDEWKIIKEFIDNQIKIN